MAIAEILLEGMRDPEPDVHRAAVRGLTKEHLDAAVAYTCSSHVVSVEEARGRLLMPLVQALEDEDESVRSAAIVSLAKHSPERAEDPTTESIAIAGSTGFSGKAPAAYLKPKRPRVRCIQIEQSGRAEGSPIAIPTPEQRQAANAALVSLWTDIKGNSHQAKAAKMTPRAIRKALDGGADVDTLDSGYTALSWAAYVGRLETVSILLEAKADVNISHRYHRTTPLTGAAVNGRLDIVRRLLKEQPNVDAQDITIGLRLRPYATG